MPLVVARMSYTDTIIAPATSPGEGGIGILRISGPLAETALTRFFRPAKKLTAFASHRLYYGHIYTVSGELVDEVMAVLMRAPASYTREDVVEFHCHGGSAVLYRVQRLLLEEGLRLAAPGEFTQRAFLNGRIDLTQAEAVIDVIRARSDAARQLAVQQMEGGLYREMEKLSVRLRDLVALVEAYIDFPDEEIALPDNEQLSCAALQLIADMDALLASFDSGRVLREGISILIVGRPNVGKSSLLNALLGESRAIVTDIPGTTRDFIEEGLTINGLPLRLVDTAGIRRTDDPVEAEGVRRSQQKIASADLQLLLVDGNYGVSDDDLYALGFCDLRRTLLVVTKSDLVQKPLLAPFADLERIELSSRTGFGLAALRETIFQRFSVSGLAGREALCLSNSRHFEALSHCSAKIVSFHEQLAAGLSAEFLAYDLREALFAIGEITGETTPDDVLNIIFERFCIGK